MTDNKSNNPPATPIARTTSPKRILVVDDEPSVANTIRMILTIDRHEVEIAEHGEKALAMFKPGKYDLVVTDFQMPGMDGLELARAIRALSPAQPVILLTAYIEAIPNSKGTISNVNVALGKPFSVAELRETVARLLPAP